MKKAIKRLIVIIRQVIVGNKLKVPPKGSLIKFKCKDENNIWYARVDGFYDILPECGGGRGVHYTYLGGQGNGSTPESRFEKIKKYRKLRDIQNEINNNLIEIW